MSENFKEWLRRVEEAISDTGDVASFARPFIGGPAMDRMYPEPVGIDDDKKKRHAREKAGKKG